MEEEEDNLRNMPQLGKTFVHGDSRDALLDETSMTAVSGSSGRRLFLIQFHVPFVFLNSVRRSLLAAF